MNVPDPIDEAIARSRVAAQPTAPAERRITGQIRMSSGRMVELNVPTDISDVELVDLVGQITTTIRAQLRQGAAPAGRLLVPRR